MKKHYMLCLFFMLFGFQGYGQLLPPNQPEQDACNALVLCGSSFSSPYSYQGLGAVNNLSLTPCGAGEANSVWMKLTINTPGSLVFSIAPVAPLDDYDFAVVNITNKTCSNFSYFDVVRCNFNNNLPGSNVNGVIGLNSTSLLQSVAGGTFGNSYCQQINATAGQVYLIMINNFGNSSFGGPSSGFTISFAGSTATFNNPPPPHLQSVVPPVCNYKNEITLQLTTQVKCNSIAANGTDFYLTPSGTIGSAVGVNCSGTQGYTNKVKLTFSPALAPGNYVVHAQQGTDGNTLLDLCNNPLPLPDQLSFQVPNLTKTISLTKCTGQLPFAWNGITIPAGSVTNPSAAVYTTLSAAGCDSVVTLNLTVTPVLTNTVSLTKCTNQLPFTWNGITIPAGSVTNPSAAVYTTTSAAGCDSVVTLNLTVTPVLTNTVSLTKCNNQLPFTWNGITIPAGSVTNPSAAVYTTLSAAGCDSVVTLNLTVTPVLTNTVSLTKCNNQLPFTWNGITVSAGGASAAVYTTTSSAGCDSVVTLNLTVTPVLTNTVSLTKCNNQLPFTWNGITIPAGSVTNPSAAVYTTLSAAGCDSVVTLNLTVTPVLTNTVSLTKCNNQLPFTWNGITIPAGSVTNPSAAVYTTTSAAGCDSVVTLNLTVTPVLTNTVSLTKCNNQLPFAWNGITIPAGSVTNPSAAVYTTTSAAGCDSVVTLNLTVTPVLTNTVSLTKCNNQLPFTWNGITIPAGSVTNPSAAVYTTTSAAGCDSAVTLNLTVTPVLTNMVSLTKCTNQLPFTWNGITIPAGSVTNPSAAVYTTTSAAGCDSVVTLNLTVTPVLTNTVSLTKCNNQLPFTWNGITIPAGSVTNPSAAVYTTLSAAGCDSVVTLNLTVTPVLTNTVSLTKCNNQLPFTWNGITIPAGSVTNPSAAVYTTLSAAGCDSVVTLNLTVTPVLTNTVSLTKCNNQLPFTWNGITVSTGGPSAAVYATLNTSGCDSIVTLNLTVTPVLTNTVSLTKCTNQLPFTWNGITIPAGSVTNPSAAVYTTLSAAGCDSVVTLNLTVTPVLTNTVSLTKCNNQLPFTWNGITIPAGSVTNPSAAVYTTLSAAGCDSVVTLNLTVTPVLTNTVSLTKCTNQLPFTWNGITVSTGGPSAAVYATLNTSGCDSIVTLNLTVTPVLTNTVSLTKCTNQLPFTWNGITVSAGGPSAAVYTTLNASGCDSIVTLNLTVNAVLATAINETICSNQLPYTWNGISVTAAGPSAAVFTTPSAFTGCDSITTLNLMVQTPVSFAASVSGCGQVVFEGAAYTVSQVLTDTFHFGTGCDSMYRTITINVYPVNPLVLDIDTAGCGSVVFEGNIYTQNSTLVDTMLGVYGCDSLYRTTHVWVYPNTPIQIRVDTVACNELVFENETYTSDTVLSVMYKSVYGCDSALYIVNIYIETFELQLTAQPPELVEGEVLHLFASSNTNYLVSAWLPQALFSNQNAYEQHIKPDHTQENFMVVGYSDFGCIDTAVISVQVDSLITDLFIPNAFSPNGDGLNDVFGPRFLNNSGYQIVDFRIFNRWGEAIYAGLNKTAAGWNGSYNGKPADAGVYHYYLKVRFVNGKTLDRKGEVTLIR